LAEVPEISRDFQSWDKEDVYHSGDAFFSSMFTEIDRARERVDFETYIYEDDTVGRAVAQKLVDAAALGVRVRVMVDGVGSPGWLGHFAPRLLAAGVEARVYHPLPWTFLFGPYRRPWAVASWIRLFKKINRRNHRKVALIDQRVAFLGSMNVSRCHVESIAGTDAWRDTGVRVEGSLVGKLDEAFEQAWQEAWAPGRGRRGWLRGRFRRRWAHRQGDLVRTNYSRSLRQLARREFLRRIVDARVRVWITNPYFVPHSLLIQALCFAAVRGVDVKLLVPAKSDVVFMHWVAVAFYGQLLQAGIRVFEYEPRILHAKTFLIDEWVSVGSNNLNHRSLIHDLEVDVGLTHRSSQESLEKQFLIDLGAAHEVTLAEWRRVPWWTRLAGRMVLWFKHFL
jgi:cardiolipin synthase